MSKKNFLKCLEEWVARVSGPHCKELPRMELKTRRNDLSETFPYFAWKQKAVSERHELDSLSLYSDRDLKTKPPCFLCYGQRKE